MTLSNAKIILHCGAPKTGSTSLQHFFRDHEALLNKNAIHYPHRFFSRRDVDPLHRAFVRSRRRRDQAEAIESARERLRAFFQDPATKKVLISNESLLGEPFVFGSDAFFPAAATALPALQEIFTGYDVHVRFFIRSQAGYIPSYYVQHVRRGGACSFKAFVDALDLGDLSWTRIVGSIKQAFGADKVRVYDHQALLDRPQETVNDMLGAFVDNELPRFDPRSYRMNQSVGGLALEATRLVNGLLAKAPSASPYQKGVVTRNVVLKPISLITPSRKPRLSEELEQRLESQYALDRELLTDP